jgi:hypothetical protein
MIRLETTRIVMVVISFVGSGAMGGTLQRAVGFLERYLAASNTEVGVVEQTDLSLPTVPSCRDVSEKLPGSARTLWLGVAYFCLLLAL